jgi:sugar lactone lactonase YvrE
LLESVLALPAGNVLFHDLKTGEWVEVASGIPYANGIAIDRLRKRLYVASALSSRLLAFPWDPSAPSKRLSGREEISLGFLPDNLAWEDQNTLWAAGSEVRPLSKYMCLLRDRAPSHVARICLPEPRAPQAELLQEAEPLRVSSTLAASNRLAWISRCRSLARLENLARTSLALIRLP